LELRIVLMKKLEIQEIFQLSWSSKKKWETIGSALGKVPNLLFSLLDLAGTSHFINLNDIQKKN
tara:strand:- start:577 stop:768 length:192 start_codon:yes stop_codon:yes gene_type:complete